MQAQKVLVWDWPVRLMHWLLALLFTGLIITGKSDGDFMELHFYFGYGLSAVILARVIYGFIGSDFARFKQFIYHPVDVFKYSKTLLTGKGGVYLGHNPVGGVMVVLLLLALTAQWGSGLFTSDEIFWFGPFYGTISDEMTAQLGSVHHFLPNILLALVALHILAVLYHELRFKERLIAAMLHGKKPQQGKLSEPIQTPRIAIVLSLGLGLAWLVWLWSIPV